MSRQHDPAEAPELEAVTRLLAHRAELLRDRPGLCDRVFHAVEREIDAPIVVASIGTAQWHRSLAIAAGVLLACGLVATLVLRGEGRSSASPGSYETLAVADGSNAERVLIAIMGSTESGASVDGAAMLDEFIPGSSVQLDELDREMSVLIGESRSVRKDNES